MTTPDPVRLAQDEQARSELEEVRTRIVELWNSGDSMSGREIVGSAAGGLLMGLGLLVFGVGAKPVGGYGDYGADDVGWVVTGLLILFAAWRAVRSTALRRVGIWREVRRLRRRERSLAAGLPAGTAGGNSYRRYYGERFGNPALLVIYVGMFVVLLLVLFR